MTGYKQPPKSTQFSKGRSGNPKGRPIGTRNLKMDLTSVLKKRFKVREDGEVRHVSGQEAMLLRLLAKALNGDVKAATTITGMAMKFDPPSNEQETAKDDALSEKDDAIIEDFLRRESAEPEETSNGKT